MDSLTPTERALREALRVSDERAALALDAADAGVFDCDLLTGEVYGSARYRSMLGLGDGPIDAQATIDLIHPDDHVRVKTPWEMPEVAGRLVWTARVRGVNSTEYRLIETRAKVLRDDNGRPVRLIGVMQDVTEAAARVDALRESERRLAEAQRVAGIGSWSWDPQSNEITWTDELFRLYELPRAGRAGPSFDEYVNRLSPDVRDRLLASIELALRDGTPYDFEHDVVRLDGTQLRVRSYGGPIFGEDGRVARLVGTAQDMTVQWSLSERVRQNEERYALALEGTSDGIWHYDFLTRQTEVSPRLLAMLGYPHQDSWVSSDWILEVLPESDLSLLRDAVRRHLNEDAPLDMELRFRTPTRELRWYRLRGRALRDENGTPLRLAGALSDVTEQRALQARLHQDSKMNALGTLAGGIAHDFNNLVAAMLGYAQLAADEVPASSPVAGHLQQVMTAARRAREIVREMLAFSRADEPRRSAVDLLQLAQETEQLLRPTLPDHVDFAVAGLPGSLMVLADGVQLQRVLMNLCSNAVDAVRASGGQVVLRVSRVFVDEPTGATIGVVPGGYVRLQVIDNGVGIPPDVLGRVFDPFFTTKAVGEGTGLGLSVVHGIVVAAGGTVQMESIEGAGTTVSVWLPQLAPRTAGAEPIVGGVAGGRRILVIDDDPAVGRLLQVALQRAHHEVQLFTSSRAAMEALTSRAVECDCIVTDFAMPEITGIELLLRIREAGVNTPAIMVTGFADGAPQEARERAQVLAMMEKPVELRAFIETVGLALASR